MLKHWLDIILTAIVTTFILIYVFSKLSEFGMPGTVFMSIIAVSVGYLNCRKDIQAIRDIKNPPASTDQKSPRWQKFKRVHHDATIFMIIIMIIMVGLKLAGMEMHPNEMLCSLMGAYLVGVGLSLTFFQKEN